MKIECPSCHLTGKLNEVNIPDEGRNIPCPRCKTSFYVAKPQPDNADHYRANVCPACYFSTFTDETFTECPKCGISVREFHQRKQQLADQPDRNRTAELNRTTPAAPDEERRRAVASGVPSARNPDLVRSLPPEEETAAPAEPPQPVKVAAIVCFVVGLGLFCYGGYGLVNYYRLDWRAILSEPLLEPLSAANVFFRMAFVPWVVTIFSIAFLAVTWRFLKLTAGADREMAWAAWGGIAVGIIHETAGFIHWLRMATGTVPFLYYVTGFISSFLVAAIWAAPFLALLWFLGTDAVAGEFP